MPSSLSVLELHSCSCSLISVTITLHASIRIMIRRSAAWTARTRPDTHVVSTHQHRVRIHQITRPITWRQWRRSMCELWSHHDLPKWATVGAVPIANEEGGERLHVVVEAQLAYSPQHILRRHRLAPLLPAPVVSFAGDEAYVLRDALLHGLFCFVGNFSMRRKNPPHDSDDVRYRHVLIMLSHRAWLLIVDDGVDRRFLAGVLCLQEDEAWKWKNVSEIIAKHVQK